MARLYWSPCRLTWPRHASGGMYSGVPATLADATLDFSSTRAHAEVGQLR